MEQLSFYYDEDTTMLPAKPENSWRWATVVNSDPLVIRLDGESSPLADTPSTLAKGLQPGQRVWVQIHGQAVIVLGVAGGAQ